MSERGWLIDTNVVSELRKPGCHAAVRTWADRVPRVACFISRITLAEIRFGIARVNDPGFRAELESWVRDGLLPWFADRLLEVDERVLTCWQGLVHAGRKRQYTYSQPDALLAASALVHELGVVTRNEADFREAGVRILNPWTEIQVEIDRPAPKAGDR